MTMMKGLVILWGEIKGEVEICETDTLQNVRALILEEFDNDMLPCQDFCFHLNDIRVSEKQESKKKAWNISTISLHSKQERQGIKRKLESENEMPTAAASALASMAPMHRTTDDFKWDVRYNQLKQIHDKAGVGGSKAKDSAITGWVTKQKNLLKNDKLDPSRQERLMKLGIDLCLRKRSVSKVNEQIWQSQLEKLGEYHQIKGDCNVPFKVRSLGPWVHNQRRLYAEMKSGERDMNPVQIQKLEQLGFEW